MTKNFNRILGNLFLLIRKSENKKLDEFLEKPYFPEEQKNSLLNGIFSEVLKNTKINNIKDLIEDDHYDEDDTYQPYAAYGVDPYEYGSGE